MSVIAKVESSKAHETALPGQGQLQAVSSRELIEYLHRTKFTGTLNLSSREKRKKIWFRLGEVFRIQSNLVPELIGRMMVDRGWLTEADLQTVLKMQRDLVNEGKSVRRIGQLVQEIHGVDSDEINVLVEQQALTSFLQSLTWVNGDYEFQNFELAQEQKPIVKFAETMQAVQSMFEIQPSEANEVFDVFDAWKPEVNSVELTQVSLWSILASCRRLGLSGILSVRRQNRLYEIVLKYGVPLTLYEGSFGQPRQTIVVRQASVEHEKFFVDQLFRLFSFLSGSVYFRSLGGPEISNAQSNAHLQFRDETGVTRSVSAEDVPEELDAQLLQAKNPFVQWISRMHAHVLKTLRQVKTRLLRNWKSLLKKEQKLIARGR